MKLNKALSGLAIAGGLGAATLAWSLIEPNYFKLVRQKLPILKPGSPDFKILHISDLHMAPWQQHKQRWVSELARLEPDFVVCTGDNLGHAEGIYGIAAALDSFSNVPGAFVHGSNDYFGPRPKNPLIYITGSSKNVPPAQPLNTTELNNYFEEELGWQNLNNKLSHLNVAGLELQLMGVDDAHISYDNLPALMLQLEELESFETDQPAADLKIALTHSPYQKILNAFTTFGAHLIFAGHTHAGQIRLPGLAPLVTNCDVPRKYAHGLNIWQHALWQSYLNVSAGLGTSIYAPVRLFCRPEATLMTLTAKN